jgi:hypothetical protein
MKEKAKIEVKRQTDISMELMEEKNAMKEESEEREYAIKSMKVLKTVSILKSGCHMMMMEIDY